MPFGDFSHQCSAVGLGGFHEGKHLFAFAALTFPLIDRLHLRHEVDASGVTVIDELPRKLLRYRERRKGRHND